MPTKVKFTSSANLLKSVITKQAGNWRKGLKELVQNSIDGCLAAGVTPSIRIEVKALDDGGAQLLYTDNAGGLGATVEEVKKNFAVFGDSAKASDKRMLGMFGMGRGQTMSMIYDPVSDELKGSIEILSVSRRKAFRISNIRLNGDLGFDIEESAPTDTEPGVQWKIVSSGGKFKAKDVMKYIKKEFVLPFPIYVNNKRVRNRPHGKKVETDLAIIYIRDFGNGFELYERGLRVMKSHLFSGFSGGIVTKTPLNLNFARNDVIEDRRWDEIKKVVKDACFKWFEERSDSKHVSESKETGLVEKMAEDSEVAERFAAERVIPLANGDKVSLNEIRSGKVLTAKTGDRAADDLIVTGTKVLDRDREGFEHVEALLRSRGTQVSAIEDVPEMREKRKCKTVEPKDDERKPLKFLNQMMRLCGYRQRRVVVGLCDLNSYYAWTDAKKFIAIRQDVLRKAMKRMDRSEGAMAFWLELAGHLAHEQAHDSDDTQTAVHGPAFRERNLKILEQLIRSTSHFDVETIWRTNDQEG
jgi:hypothetical protein